MTPKTAPWCLTHRDNIVAKVPGQVPGWDAHQRLHAHTRWPLYVRLAPNTMISDAQARVWQLATASAFAAAKHMLFCLPGLHRQDN